MQGIAEPYGVRILELPKSFDMPPEDGLTYLENARIKAHTAAAALSAPVIADDSGIEVAALGWGPGPRSARFAGEPADDRANNRLLLELLRDASDRRARYRAVLVLVDGQREIVAHATVEGVILEAPRGEGGFGYDPLFYVPELGRSKAELTRDEKSRISHRGQAMREILALLQDTGRLRSRP